ncbi:hypothetical protein [Streptococcus salivarius]|uniref:hypothetical protein n=1 Tax=Streptococcus salivarius TaxID=1304 RepID=UPI001583C7F4|nr:hypothetical protein [Streptococcus salivarius]
MNHIHDFIEFMQKGRTIPEWDFTTYMLFTLVMLVTVLIILPVRFERSFGERPESTEDGDADE